MDLKKVISKQISFQSNAWSNIEKGITIGGVIKDIKIDDAEIVEEDRCIYYTIVQRLKDKKIYNDNESPIAVPSFIFECENCSGYFNERPYYVVGE